MTRDELKAALKAGPGSRELSDEFLLAMGWYRISDSHDFLMPPGGYKVSRQPNPTLNTDDALAMVPDGWAITHTYWDRKRAACNLMNEGRKYACGPSFFKCPIVLGHNFLIYTNFDPLQWGVLIIAPTLALAICLAILEIE
jgi:hypothetical protein